MSSPPAYSAADSVGLVTPQRQHFAESFTLASGRVLPEFELVYETYGKLNAQASNGVLICHALSGHHHAAGYHREDERKPGWWDSMIGPGKPIDTRHFFVVCVNNLGGCHGSTGPLSVNPETGSAYGPDFPSLRVRDWVHSQAKLADRLGIAQWAAVIGGSLGGMQVMRWSVELPERVRHAIVIASAMRLSAQNIAFNEIARQAILSDPDFCEGWYAQQQRVPSRGLAIARMVGHITYLSEDAMAAKFGRDLRSGDLKDFAAEDVEFQVESYLRYQGSVFSTSFDPVTAFRQARAAFLVLSFSSDWRFPPERSREIANALIGARKAVSYADIEASQGHDAFLMPIPRYLDVMRAYLRRVADECRHA
jgi:homoserine O-acetyltransferase